MTKFHDPSRPRSPADRPQWMGSLVVLPTVDLTPLDEREYAESSPLSQFRWRVRVMNGGNGSWYFCDLTPDELQIFLTDWREDPEKAFCDFFGREDELPKGLGAGRQQARSAPPTPLVSTVEGEGLDF